MKRSTIFVLFLLALVVIVIAKSKPKPKVKVTPADTQFAECNHNIKQLNYYSKEFKKNSRDPAILQKLNHYQSLVKKNEKKCKALQKEVKEHLNLVDKDATKVHQLNKYWFVPKEPHFKENEEEILNNYLARKTSKITVAFATRLVESGKRVFQSEIIPLRRFVRSAIEIEYLQLAKKSVQARSAAEADKKIKKALEDRVKQLSLRLTAVKKTNAHEKQTTSRLFTSAIFDKVHKSLMKTILRAAHQLNHRDARVRSVARKVTQRLVSQKKVDPKNKAQVKFLLKQVSALEHNIKEMGRRLERSRIRKTTAIDKKQKVALQKHIRQLQFKIFSSSMNLKDMKHKLNTLIKHDDVNGLIQKVEEARVSFIIHKKNKLCKCYCYPKV